MIKAPTGRITFAEEPTLYAMDGIIVAMLVFMACISPILALVALILASLAVAAEKQADRERQRGIEINVRLAFALAIMRNRKR